MDKRISDLEARITIHRHYGINADGSIYPEDHPQKLAALFRDEAKRRIAETTLRNYWVTTTFTVANLAKEPGPPVVFETLVHALYGDDVQPPVDSQRYSTYEDAKAGHDAMVDKYRHQARLRVVPSE